MVMLLVMIMLMVDIFFFGNLVACFTPGKKIVFPFIFFFILLYDADADVNVDVDVADVVEDDAVDVVDGDD